MLILQWMMPVVVASHVVFSDLNPVFMSDLPAAMYDIDEGVESHL